MRVSELVSYGAPPGLVQRWAGQFDELTEVQEHAVRAGVLAGTQSLLIVAPTSSGKTFVGEMAAASAVLRGGRTRAVVLVPFKALAEEHYAMLRERYADLFTVVISTGDRPEWDDEVRRGRFHLAVMTYEKFRNLLVQDLRFLDKLAALIVDEVQMIGDAGRGSALELVLTRVLRHPDPPRLVALSASLDELGELPRWLRAEPIVSTERPVPLREGVCALVGDAIYAGPDGALERERLCAPQPDRDALVAHLAADAVRAGEQVLVFRSTVARTASTARAIASRLPATGVAAELGQQLASLESTEATHGLAFTMASGVAYHNAELSFGERALVERGFRSGALRVIVSTTTLAMGVNLPCDKVIVADATRVQRVGHSWTFPPISVADYKNAAGRAGRLGSRTAGVALLLTDGVVESEAVARQYLMAPTELVRSRIPGRPFGDLVFELLASGLAGSRDEIVAFVRSTFAYATFYRDQGGGQAEVERAVDDAVAVCLASGLIERDGDHLRATQVAASLAPTGVAFASAVRLAELAEAVSRGEIDKAGLLYEICLCAEMPVQPFPPDSDPRQALGFTGAARAGSRLAHALSARDLAEPAAHGLVRLAFLIGWISGVEQRSLSSRFPGATGRRGADVGRTAAWLIESLARVVMVRGAPDRVIRQLRELELELRYGLPAVLAALARLEVRGVGRADLLRLHASGRSDVLDLEALLDLGPEEVNGLITASQLERIKTAIIATERDSLRRRQAEHLVRAERAHLKDRLVRDLYEARGGGLEQAVLESLQLIGLSARRVLRQPQGEPDIVVEYGGTVVVSVTASADDAAGVKWAKTREILSAGAGLNPVNCVCVARPGFLSSAEQAARELAREDSGRRLLLLSVPQLCEILLRHAEGVVSTDEVGRVFSTGRGVLDDALLSSSDSESETSLEGTALS